MNDLTGANQTLREQLDDMTASDLAARQARGQLREQLAQCKEELQRSAQQTHSSQVLELCPNACCVAICFPDMRFSLCRATCHTSILCAAAEPTRAKHIGLGARCC